MVAHETELYFLEATNRGKMALYVLVYAPAFIIFVIQQNTLYNMEKTIHQGRNIKRFREMLGIKQDALAAELGDDWDQVKVSRLEAKEEVEDKLLEQLAGVLKVPVEAFKNFDEEAAVNIISNTFHEHAFIGNKSSPISINPIEKLIETMEENKKLYEELLKAKEEQIKFLEALAKK